MPFNFFKKLRSEFPEEDEYIELKFEGEEAEREKIMVVIENLRNYADSDKIQRKLREGYIVLIKIKELKDKDLEELKRAISRIKKTCIAIGGDIAGISDDWVIATPHFAKIERQKIEEEKQ